MRTRNMIRHAALAALALALLTGAARAGDHPHHRRGLVLGLNMGPATGALEYERFGSSIERDLEDGSGGALRLGYGVSDQVVLAVEARGFQLEDGAEDVDFHLALFSVTWHPGGGGFFLRTGVGRGFTTLNLDAPDSADWSERETPAALIGLGYEWRLGRQFALGVALDAYGTEFDDLPTFRNTTLGAGLASVQLQWYL